MPQSEEHLRILEVLGVRDGVVAITKADLVDEDTLELVRLEVEERLAGSPLADLPVVVCDGRSRRGVDALARALDDALAAAPDATDSGRPRLWVDRVFAAKGAGTVVTGTLTRGHLATDADVVVGEPPRAVRIRSVETAGERVAAGAPGTRVALNLVGVEHRDLARGDAVVVDGQWLRPLVVDVAVTLLPGIDLRPRGRLQAYVGSGEHPVWFRVLGDHRRFARVRFETPVPLAIGDRFVLRDPGPDTTVAGAEVLDLEPTTRAKDAAPVLELAVPARVLATHPWIDAPELARRVGDIRRRRGGDVALARRRRGCDGGRLVARRTRDRSSVSVVRRPYARSSTTRGQPHDAGIEIGRPGRSAGGHPRPAARGTRGTSTTSRSPTGWCATTRTRRRPTPPKPWP